MYLKETDMAGATMNNGHTQRKTLATQIDRLDSILDGLADALNESVACAVRDVVGQAVQEAVQATIREVLGNPELLRASLARHAPPPAPVAKRLSLKELLVSAGAQACEKARKAIGWAWSSSLNKLQQGIGLIRRGCERANRGCSLAFQFVEGVVRFAAHYRRTCFIALAVGILSGVAVYYSGPVVSGIVNGLNSAALTVSGMILMPLWRLFTVKTVEA
jgi:hypothetical protein